MGEQAERMPPIRNAGEQAGTISFVQNPNERLRLAGDCARYNRPGRVRGDLQPTGYARFVIVLKEVYILVSVA